MHNIQGICGVGLPTVFVVLGAFALGVVTFVAFLPELTGRPAHWLGPAESRTGIPISLASRISGTVFAWVGAALFVVVHPLTLLGILPLAFISDVLCRHRDKQKFIKGSNNSVEDIGASRAESSR